MNSKSKSLIANRYQLLKKLGVGAMGIVHSATDRLTGEMVALKQITLATEKLQFASRPTDDDIETLRLALATEFRTLAGLRHPNIISVIDYGFDEVRQPFFTMDYISEAENLLEAGQGKTTEEKVELLVQVLQALIYLHRRGILHRDLKPENVLVQDGQVRVLDFGLAAAREEASGRIGTPAHMAPETIRTGQVSEVADLYAVGVLAYALFADQLPFADISSILRQEADLSAIEAPITVIDVIDRLLKKTPEDRYSDALETQSAFLEAIDQPIPIEDTAIRESFLQAATFVGRENEMAQLTQALEAAIQGRGSAWLVGGESGVGKSRLLDELRAHALVNGAQVLRGQAVEGSGLPYQLWRNALQRSSLVTELSDLQAGVLKPLVTDIDTLLGRPIPEPPELEGQAVQQRLVLTIAEVLSQAAQTQPLVLLLDDLQWSMESLEPLKALNRMVAENPILMIGSYRSEDRPDLPDDLPEMATLPLQRLAADQIAQLSVSMLGIAGKQPQVLDLLQTETEGNAFFLVETVRVLAEEAGRLEAVGQMALPEEVFAGGVQRLLQRRLSRVPLEHQPLLKLAAIAGRALDLKIINELASPQDLKGSSIESGRSIEIESWLADCASLAVLEVQENQWRFAHDKLRDELLSELSKSESLAFHRQVAVTYESIYPQDPSYAGLLAHIWNTAGETDSVRHYASIAGKHAAEQFANQDAIHFYTQALSLTPQEAETERYYLLGEREKLYDLLKEGEAWKADLDQLSNLAQTPAQKITIGLRIAGYFLSIGAYQEAILAAKRAYHLAAETEDPFGQIRAHIQEGRIFNRKGDYDLAEEKFLQALSLAEPLNDDSLLAQIWSGLGDASRGRGEYPVATKYHQQATQRQLETGDLEGQILSLRNLSGDAVSQGQYKEAEDFGLKSLDLAREIGSLAGENAGLGLMADLKYRQGRLDEASSYAEECLSLSKRIGDRGEMCQAMNKLGNIAANMGKLDSAYSWFQQALAISREIGRLDTERGLLNNLGNVLGAQGRDKKAQEYYNQSYAMFRDANDIQGQAMTLHNLGKVTQTRGFFDRAIQLLQQSLDICTDNNDQYGQVFNTCWLGETLLLQRRLDEAENAFQQALIQARDIGLKESEGVALHGLGALALEKALFSQAEEFYLQAQDVHKEIGQLMYVIEDHAGLALVAVRQTKPKKAQKHIELFLDMWQKNRAMNGVLNPIRTLHFAWQVCEALGLSQRDDVLAAAAGKIQKYIEYHPAPESQAVYLAQPHHQALWKVWQDEQNY